MALRRIGPSASSTTISGAVSDSNVRATPLLAPAVTSISTDVSMVTLWINYNFGGPVVAKY
jgi:hypothetical protein